VLTFARAAGPLVPLLPFALFTFLALAPIYYSERYSMVLLPLYLWPVAAAVEWAMRRGAAFGAIALLLVLAAAGLNLRHSAAVQSEVALLLPRETIPAGRAIRALAQPGDRVLARKGHAAYAAGLEPVLFPDVGTLDSLGEFCRRRGVRWLFYSWYEARLRPRLGFLLDTAASVPGLAPVHATHELPSATYRIEENFGATPAWWSDATVKSHIERRVSAMLAPPSESGPRFLALASEALDQGRPEDARVDAMDARLRMEKDPRALVLLGAALLQLGRPAESLDAADRALELDRTFAGAHLGRGLALKALGRNAEAAREWRPLASSSRDPRVLQAMIEVFVEQHDEAAAAEARAALESLRPTR
jgi:tetratricopeptide (TPR) repeat protein